MDLNLFGYDVKHAVEQWPPLLLACLIFSGAFLYDWFYMMYLRHAQAAFSKRKMSQASRVITTHSLKAANWGMAMIIIGTVEILAYTTWEWMIWPLFMGYWCGTFASVRFGKDPNNDGEE